MRRPCDACGKPYEAKRATSKFCSVACRNRKHKHPELKPPVEPDQPRELAPLVEVVKAALAEVDRVATPAGVRALMLASRMSGLVMDSAYAGLDKQLGVVLSEALEGSEPVDPVQRLRDELAERRERRSA